MNELQQELKREILSLCATMSVSGFEERGTESLSDSLRPHFDKMITDAVGNHIFFKHCPQQDAPTVLIDTHFDEIGMLVTEICEGGFVRLAPIGGLSPSVLQAADVILYGKEPLRGVITSTPPHLRGGGEKELPSCEELMVDTGYPREELEKLISVGTPVGFAPMYGELLNGRLMGKSFDNKAPAAIAALAVIHTPREKLAANVALLFSSYEETSRLGGAAAGAFGVDPDYAMVIDVNLAKVPDTPTYETIELGKGVSLSVSAATDRALTRHTQTLCETLELPHTMIAAPSSTGTNATAVQLVRHGIPVVDVGLPLRSMHTYNEVIDLSDAEALYHLVQAFICDQAIADRFGRKEELPC